MADDAVLSLRRAQGDAVLGQRAPSDLTPEERDIQAFQATAPEIRKGLRMGANLSAATAKAFAGAVGDAVGNPEFAARQMQEAKDLVQFGSQVGPRLRSYTEVQNLEDAADFVAGATGQVVSQMLPTVAAGLIGSRFGLRGTIASAAVPSFTMETGESVLQTADAPGTLGEKLPTNLAKGAAAAALDVAPVAYGISRIQKAARGASPALSAKQGILGGTAAEAATEAAQEKIGQIAHGAVDPNRDASGDNEAMINAAIMGGLGGGLFGGGGAALSKLTSVDPGSIKAAIGRKAKPSDPLDYSDAPETDDPQVLSDYVEQKDFSNDQELAAAEEANPRKWANYEGWREDPDIKEQFSEALREDYVKGVEVPRARHYMDKMQQFLDENAPEQGQKSKVRTALDMALFDAVWQRAPERLQGLDANDRARLVDQLRDWMIYGFGARQPATSSKSLTQATYEGLGQQARGVNALEQAQRDLQPSTEAVKIPDAIVEQLGADAPSILNDLYDVMKAGGVPLEKKPNFQKAFERLGKQQERRLQPLEAVIMNELDPKFYGTENSRAVIDEVINQVIPAMETGMSMSPEAHRMARAFNEANPELAGTNQWNSPAWNNLETAFRAMFPREGGVERVMQAFEDHRAKRTGWSQLRKGRITTAPEWEYLDEGEDRPEVGLAEEQADEQVFESDAPPRSVEDSPYLDKRLQVPYPESQIDKVVKNLRSTYDPQRVSFRSVPEIRDGVMTGRQFIVAEDAKGTPMEGVQLDEITEKMKKGGQANSVISVVVNDPKRPGRNKIMAISIPNLVRATAKRFRPQGHLTDKEYRGRLVMEALGNIGQVPGVVRFAPSSKAQGLSLNDNTLVMFDKDRTPIYWGEIKPEGMASEDLIQYKQTTDRVYEAQTAPNLDAVESIRDELQDYEYRVRAIAESSKSSTTRSRAFKAANRAQRAIDQVEEEINRRETEGDKPLFIEPNEGVTSIQDDIAAKQTKEGVRNYDEATGLPLHGKAREFGAVAGELDTGVREEDKQPGTGYQYRFETPVDVETLAGSGKRRVTINMDRAKADLEAGFPYFLGGNEVQRMLAGETDNEAVSTQMVEYLSRKLLTEEQATALGDAVDVMDTSFEIETPYGKFFVENRGDHAVSGFEKGKDTLGDASRQKALVARNLKLTQKKMKELFPTVRAYAAFLKAREESLIANYPNGRPDFMSPKAIEIETRVTRDALKKYGAELEKPRPKPTQRPIETTPKEQAKIAAEQNRAYVRATPEVGARVSPSQRKREPLVSNYERVISTMSGAKRQTLKEGQEEQMFEESVKEMREAKRLADLVKKNEGKLSKVKVGAHTITPREEAEVRDYIEKVMGPSAKTLFAAVQNAGEFLSLKGIETFTFSIHMIDSQSVAGHEAMHGLMSRLRLSSAPVAQQAANTLHAAATSPNIVAKLRQLLKGEPAALKQLDDVNERVAYMFQFWRSGDLAVGPKTKTLFEKIVNMVHRAWHAFTGIGDNPVALEKAEMVMRAFDDGKLANRSNIPRALREAGLERQDDMSTKVGNWAERIFSTADGYVRDMNVPALTAIADKFYNEQGQGGFVQTKHVFRNQFMNRYTSIMRSSPLWDSLSADARKQLGERYIADLRSGNMKNSQVRELRKLLDDMYNYMQERGVRAVVWNASDKKYEEHKLNRVNNFVPRVYNAEAVRKDMDGLTTLLQKYGWSKADADATVLTLANETHAAPHETDRAVGITMFSAAAQKRAINVPDTELAPYLHSDLDALMHNYIANVVRRSEYASRFGNQGQEIRRAIKAAEEQGATEEQLKGFAGYVQAMEGTIGHNIDPTLRNFMGGVQTYQNLRLLPLALFSSLVDPLGIAMRSGEWSDAPKAFVRGVRELVSNKQDSARELAELLGAVNSATDEHMVAEMYSQNHSVAWQKWLNRKLFQLNGMESWNNSMRVHASAAARKFIKKHVQNPNEHSARYMAELGLDPQNVTFDANGEVNLTPEVVDALNRWVDGAVLRPHAAHRPIWMSDPHFMLVSHLKQFTYSFQKTIVSRAFTEAYHGNYKPLGVLASYVPFILAADIMRALLTPGGIDDDRLAKYTATDWLRRGVYRSGMLGPGEYAFHAAEGNQAAVLGPSAEQLLDILTSIGNGDKFSRQLLRAVPPVPVLSLN